MVDVDVERPLELPSAEDERAVQALLTDRAHPAPGVGVRVGRLDRCLDHPDAVASKTSSKAAVNMLTPTEYENQYQQPSIAA
jgi:hypothetical protein